MIDVWWLGGKRGFSLGVIMEGKVKVLHVLGRLDRGGVETWLMHVLRHIDRERFQLVFW